MAPPSTERELSQELASIIACPYPASLKTLADILAASDDRAVRASIHHLSSCATTRLASIVSGCLSLFPYTLSILHALCHSTEFRDALLGENPRLLDALLNKATTSQREFDEYETLCVLLLSRPLPQASPLPASTQPFFLRLFNKAVQNPDVNTLKPIYSALNGACRGLLDLLTPEVRHAFDKELCHILQSNSTGQNSMLFLWCMGIVVLVEHSHNVVQIPQPAHERQWKTASGRKLFGSTNGSRKTINLTYLSVIWASKGGVGLSDYEAIEGIRIATRAMQLIDQTTRAAWPSSGLMAQETAPRLVSKIQRRGIDAGVKLEALSFYATIVGAGDLSPDVIAEYEAVLLDVQSIQTDAPYLEEILKMSLPLFAPKLRESTIRRLLASILNTNSTSGQPDELTNISVLVVELTALVQNCAAFRHELLSALSSNELKESAQNFLQITPEFCSEESRKGCDTSIRLLRRRLQSDTVSMLLTAALTAQTTEHMLSQTLAIGLISKQQKLCQFTTQCSHPKSNVQPAVSLFELGCTPATGTHQQDWRGHLKLELERTSSYQYDALIRSVAMICEDLESRCLNAEEPLRQEQAKVRDLTAKVQDLTAQGSKLREEVLSLETELVENRFIAQGLDSEKEDALVKLAELGAEFARANKEADEILRTARAEFHTREKELEDMILTNENDLHSRDQQLKGLNGHIRDLKAEVQKEYRERESLSELHESLKANLEAIGRDLLVERQTATQRAEQVAQLEASSNELESALNRVRKELGEAIQQRDGLQARCDELVRSSAESLKDLEARYEQDMQTVISKANDEYKQMQTDLQNATRGQQRAKTAWEDTRQALQRVQATASELEEENKQLTDACRQKDVELDHLKAWKNRVYLSMGLPVDNAIPVTSHVESDKHRQSFKSTRQHRRRRSAAPAQDIISPRESTGTRGISNTAMEDVADASFSSDSFERSGSTPKRIKSGPFLKGPAVRTPPRQKLAVTSGPLTKQISSPRRSALGAVSPNRRHTTVGFAIPENEGHGGGLEGKRRDTLHFGEQAQASFDMDTSMTSTPFTPGHITCGTGRGPEDELDEDITEL